MAIHRSVLPLLLAVLACTHDPEMPPGANEITVEIHRSFPFIDGDTADDATFVAIQDGDEPYVPATGTNGVYRVRVASDRFGIAVGCLDTASTLASIEIVQRVIADGTTYKTVCKSIPADKELAVTVKNMPANSKLRLRAPLSIANVTKDDTAILNVQPGTVDVFGTLTDANNAVVKLFRIPNVHVPATTALAIDVAASGAAPELHPLTFDPADPTATVRTAVVRPYGNITIQAAGTALGATPRYIALPAALRQPDDLMRVVVSGPSGSAARTTVAPGALAFRLPAAFTAPIPELVKTPFLHPVWTFTPTPSALPTQEYVLDASNLSANNATIFRDWFATLSSGWVAGAASVRYEFPDLSAMPGFADVALKPREAIDTTISRLERTADAAIDGAESTASSATAAIGEFCGDGVIDPAAGEQCDPPDGTTCSETCTKL